MEKRILDAGTFGRITELTHRIENQRQVACIDGDIKITYTFLPHSLLASFRDLEGKERVIIGAEIDISDVTDGLRPNQLVRASYRRSGNLYEVDFFNPGGGVRLAMPEDELSDITIMCMDSGFIKSQFSGVMRFGEHAACEELLPYEYRVNNDNDMCVVKRIDKTGGPEWTVKVPMRFGLIPNNQGE